MASTTPAQPQVTTARTADVLGYAVHVDGQLAGHVRQRADRRGWVATLTVSCRQVATHAKTRTLATDKLAAAWLAGHR